MIPITGVVPLFCMPKPKTPKQLEREIADMIERERDAHLSLTTEPLPEEPVDDFDIWIGRNTDS